MNIAIALGNTLRSMLLANDSLPELTIRQLSVMLALYNEACEPTIRALSAHLSLSKPAITRAFDRLVEEGLMIRRPDPSDRRSIDGVLTPDGRRYVNTMSRIMGRELNEAAKEAA